MSDRRLKVGVQLPEVERVVRWAELRDMARAAEDVGFDSLWVGDHLLYRNPGEPARGPWEAWSTLAALAAVTRRVEIGPLVACTAFHAPAVLAKKAATIDEISDGRLTLALGAGWNELEFQAFGASFDRRVSRFEEAFTIIRTLLREGEIDFRGRYYEVRDCEIVPRGPRDSGPTLLVGARGPRMLRLAAAHADGWNAWHAWFGNRPERLDGVLGPLDAACDAVGRPRAALERTSAVLVQLPGGRGRAAGDAAKRGVAPLAGSDAELAARLAEFGERGLSHVQLVLDPIDRRSIERLGPVLERLRRR